MCSSLLCYVLWNSENEFVHGLTMLSYWQKHFLPREKVQTSFVGIRSGIFIVIESSLGLRHFYFWEAITCYDNLLHTWWHLLKLSFFMKRSRVYLVVSVACFSSTEAWIMQTDIILSFYSSISSRTCHFLVSYI